MLASFDPQLGPVLLSLARKTLTSYLQTKTLPPVGSNLPALQKKCGVFVALKKARKLRGCMGIIESNLTLSKNVQKMALASATADPRFAPIDLAELSQIKIELTLLDAPQKIQPNTDLSQGTLGIIQEKDQQKIVTLIAATSNLATQKLLAQLAQHQVHLKKEQIILPTSLLEIPNLFLFQSIKFAET